MTDRVAAAVEATDKDAFTVDERGAPIRQSTALRAITRLLRLLDAPERSRVLEIGTAPATAPHCWPAWWAPTAVSSPSTSTRT